MTAPGCARASRRSADRRPTPDTLVWRGDQPVPPGLREVYRAVRCTGDRFFATPAEQRHPELVIARGPGGTGGLLLTFDHDALHSGAGLGLRGQKRGEILFVEDLEFHRGACSDRCHPGSVV